MISEELIPAKLVKRYKRFLADVLIENSDEIVTVHCPNPGSMLGVAEADTKIWLRKAINPKSKYSYAWVLSELPSSFVSVDTLLANKLLNQSLNNGSIEELHGYASIKSEQKFQSSRFDFFLSEHKNHNNCFLEVKSTTLCNADLAMFPDAKTERGRKHLHELIECRKQGLRAVQFFCVSRTDCKRFQAAAEIDKAYADALSLAFKAGVEVYAYSLKIKQIGNQFQYQLGSSIEVIVE